MAKLYFRYGTVGSAKTLNLLAVAHNYEQQSKKVLVLAPEIDTRFGSGKVRSRSGLEKNADLLVGPTTQLKTSLLKGVACVLVDECQFLSAAFIEHLREVSRDKDIPVICYGLRNDFRTQLFEGSRRLMELADSIEEVKNTCHFCNKKAIFNLKTVGGRATLQGPTIELGSEELYLPACARCYHEKLL